MPDPFGVGVDVHFVDPGLKSDWREVLADEEDLEDEELEETPADVIEVLGFDPKELGD